MQNQLHCFTVEKRTVEQWRILEMEALLMKPVVRAANGNVKLCLHFTVTELCHNEITWVCIKDDV